MDEQSTTEKVKLSVQAKSAASVSLVGVFNEWDPAAAPMARNRRGIWRAKLELAPGEYEYRFVIDGEWCEDPECAERRPNPYGGSNSVLRV